MWEIPKTITKMKVSTSEKGLPWEVGHLVNNSFKIWKKIIKNILREVNVSADLRYYKINLNGEVQRKSS